MKGSQRHVFVLINGIRRYILKGDAELIINEGMEWNSYWHGMHFTGPDSIEQIDDKELERYPLGAPFNEYSPSIYPSDIPDEDVVIGDYALEFKGQKHLRFYMGK